MTLLRQFADFMTFSPLVPACCDDHVKLFILERFDEQEFVAQGVYS